MKPIIVVNPNSTQSVTDGVDRSLESLRFAGGPAIECRTLAAGPPAIESDDDVANVAAPLCEYLRPFDATAGAFVIACFSDPGLEEARASLRTPVFGMAQCGYLTALSRGQRFGVVSILEESVPRHRRYIESMGIDGRLAADLPIELGVLELSQADRVRTRLAEVGGRLVREHGADTVVLGCAGMTAYREGLEDVLGVPVLEPVRCAVTMAMTAF